MHLKQTQATGKLASTPSRVTCITTRSGSAGRLGRRPKNKVVAPRNYPQVFPKVPSRMKRCAEVPRTKRQAHLSDREKRGDHVREKVTLGDRDRDIAPPRLLDRGLLNADRDRDIVPLLRGRDLRATPGVALVPITAAMVLANRAIPSEIRTVKPREVIVSILEMARPSIVHGVIILGTANLSIVHGVIKVAMGGAGAHVQGGEVPVGPGMGSQLQPGLCEKKEHTDTANGI